MTGSPLIIPIIFIVPNAFIAFYKYDIANEPSSTYFFNYEFD